MKIYDKNIKNIFYLLTNQLQYLVAQRQQLDDWLLGYIFQQLSLILKPLGTVSTPTLYSLFFYFIMESFEHFNRLEVMLHKQDALMSR